MATRLPERSTSGSPLLASWGEQVIAYLRSITPRESPDLLVDITPGGSVQRLKRHGKSTESTAAETFPFQIYQSSFIGEGEAPADQARRIRLRLGDVNGMLPSNMWTEFTIPPTVENYQVWLAVSLSYSRNNTLLTISSIQLVIGASMPAQPTGDTPASSYKLIGTVTTDATGILSISNATKTSLSLALVMSGWDCDQRSTSLTWYQA